MSNILIIEDDNDISEVLELILTAEGHHCRRASNGTKGLEETEKEEPDLITLDIMLGEDETGLDVCKKIRQRFSQTIVIVAITAKVDKITRVLASEHRVDCFIEKPFDADVLKAYVKNLPQRIKEITGEVTKKTSKKENGEGIYLKFLSVDPTRKKVYANSKGGRSTELRLTQKEVNVLTLLIQKRIALSRKEILRGAWGTNENIDPRNVDKQICSIRNKINKAYGEEVELILTEEGGYRYLELIDPEAVEKEESEERKELG